MRSVTYTYCKVTGRLHTKAMQLFINGDERPAAESTQDTWRHAVHRKSISYRQSCWGLGSTANLHQEATVRGRRTATYAACGATICLRLGCCETVSVFNWPPRTAGAERRCAQIENGARIHKSGPVASPWDTHNGLGGKKLSDPSPPYPLRTQAGPYPTPHALASPQQPRQSSGISVPERQRGGRIEDSPAPTGGQWQRLVSLLPRLTEKTGACVRVRARLRWQEWPDMIVNYLCGLFNTWPATCGPRLNSKP